MRIGFWLAFDVRFLGNRRKADNLWLEVVVEENPQAMVPDPTLASPTAAAAQTTAPVPHLPADGHGWGRSLGYQRD